MFLLQAAFKAVPSGDAGQAGTGASIKWQDVKPQDKTLVHQAGCPLIAFSLQIPAL